jgi:zinc transport system substrate-binding protein
MFNLNYSKYILIISLIIINYLGGFAKADTAKSVVVTTAMLECAVREVIPPSEKIEIIRLLPPSACPGHFDLSPRIIPVLRSAVMIIRHDYQGVLDRKLSQMGAEDISLLSIPTTGSPLIPSYYYSLVEQTGLLFAGEFPAISKETAYNTKSLKDRTDKLAESIQKRSAQWKGKPVIAAVHQKEFCEWLGFEIAGILNRPEDISPRDLEKLVGVKADIIVANLQEGMQGAISLGERMNIPVAILSNFPGADGYGTGYDDLVKQNVRRLEEAWQKR